MVFLGQYLHIDEEDGSDYDSAYPKLKTVLYKKPSLEICFSGTISVPIEVKIKHKGQMLLCIKRACHTAVQPKISRGLSDLCFCIGGKVHTSCTSPAAGFPIIVIGKK